LRELAAELPADRIMVKPTPVSGARQVSRQAQRAVLRRRSRKVLAETRGVSLEEISRQTTETSSAVFKVPAPKAAA
jgi:TatD DNase family protein